MLEGVIRESIGKKASKELKRDGYLIANIYAKGVENVYATFKTNEFVKYVRDKDSLAFDISVGGKTYNVIVEEYQKDPVTNFLTHVDLRIVLPDVLSKYKIPVKLSGTPVGLKNKGVLVQSKRRLKVECLGKDLPNSFNLNIASLDVGDSIIVRDLEIPSGVTVLEGDNVAIVGVLSA
ncbi:MAG: 50S ribosomal protein L25/general stress protein Ctc [Campylobacter sp.]|nr:50S ribosomal protein L25/general stress protein Ctc [Campylobacter sp.]